MGARGQYRRADATHPAVQYVRQHRLGENGMDDKEFEAHYVQARRSLVTLLTAANDDDPALAMQLQTELWQSPLAVDAALTTSLYVVLGLMDQLEMLTGASVAEQLQFLALRVEVDS